MYIYTCIYIRYVCALCGFINKRIARSVNLDPLVNSLAEQRAKNFKETKMYIKLQCGAFMGTTLNSALCVCVLVRLCLCVFVLNP